MVVHFRIPFCFVHKKKRYDETEVDHLNFVVCCSIHIKGKMKKVDFWISCCGLNLCKTRENFSILLFSSRYQLDIRNSEC